MNPEQISMKQNTSRDTIIKLEEKKDDSGKKMIQNVFMHLRNEER